MALARTFGAPKGVGDKLTAAEINAVDANIENATQKTAGTDTISCDWTIAAPGSLTMPADALTLSGATGYPALSTSRSLTGAIVTVDHAIFDTAVWSRPLWSGSNDIYVYCVATSPNCVSNAYTLMVGLNHVIHNGATLVSATAIFRAPTAHGALPATFPKLEIKRAAYSGAAITTLRAAGAAAYSTASLATYNDGSANKEITYTADQNNTDLDPTAYAYFAELTNETGTDALTALRWYWVKLSFSTISTTAWAHGR